MAKQFLVFKKIIQAICYVGRIKWELSERYVLVDSDS